MAHFKYHDVVSLCPHCTERIVTKIACEGAPDIKEIAPSASANISRDATVLIKSVVACLDDCGTGMSASTVEDCLGMLRKAIDIISAQQHPC